MSNLTTDLSLDGIITRMMQQPILPEELRARGMGVDDLEVLLEHDVIGSTWDKRTTAVEQRAWSLDDSTSEISSKIKDWLTPIYQDLVAYLLRARLYGLAVPELTYEKQGHFYIPTRLVVHPVSRFYVDAGGKVGVNQYGVQRLIDDLPQYKAKLFPLVNRRSVRYPAGIPMLARLYWVWFLSNNMWEYWSRYLERFGSPSLVGTVKYGMNPQTQKSTVDELRDAMMRMLNSGVGAFAEGTTITPLQTWNVGDGFNMADNKLLSRIQMYFLGQTLTTQQGSQGSHALGKVHADVLHEINAGDISFIEPAMQRIVDTITAINFKGRKPPKFDISYPTKMNTEQAARDKVLWDTGLRFSKEYYLEHYDLEERDVLGVVEPVHATGVMDTQDTTSAPETKPA